MELILIAAGLLVVPLGIRALFDWRHASQLKRARRGQTIDEITGHFAAHGIHLLRSREAYSYFQRLVNVSNFPVLPGDLLAEVYGIGRVGGVPLWDALQDFVILFGCRQTGDGVETTDPS